MSRQLALCTIFLHKTFTGERRAGRLFFFYGRMRRNNSDFGRDFSDMKNGQLIRICVSLDTKNFLPLLNERKRE